MFGYIPHGLVHDFDVPYTENFIIVTYHSQNALLITEPSYEIAWLLTGDLEASPTITEYPMEQTGVVKHYVWGHTIDGVSYEALGQRDDGSWVWTRVNGTTLTQKDADITGDARDRLNALPPKSLYRYHNLRYPNHIAYSEVDGESIYIVIVDDHFKLVERLRVGKRTPRSSRMSFDHAPHESIASMTINNNCPLSIGLLDSKRGIEFAIVKYDQLLRAGTDVDGYPLDIFVPHVDGSKLSWAKAMTRACRINFAKWWIDPMMQLQIRTFGTTGTSISVTHLVDDKGSQDVRKLWDSQSNAVRVKYGTGREWLIGHELWDDTTQEIDLDDMVFSSDYAYEIGMRAFAFYHSDRDFCEVPLARMCFVPLWWTFGHFGSNWMVLSCKLDTENRSGKLTGIGAGRDWNYINGLTQHILMAFVCDGQRGLVFYSPGEDPPYDSPPYYWEYYGYPPSTWPLVRRILETIRDDYNQYLLDNGGLWCENADFDPWWREHIIDYWDMIWELTTMLDELGFILII
jgi:hypothetical protein